MSVIHNKQKSCEVDLRSLFCSLLFNLTVYNAVNDYVGDCIQELENVIKSEVREVQSFYCLKY